MLELSPMALIHYLSTITFSFIIGIWIKSGWKYAQKNKNFDEAAVASAAPYAHYCISFIPHHLIFYGMDALPDAQPTVKALKANWKDNKQMKKLQKFMEFCDKLPTSQKAVHFAVHTVDIKLQKKGWTRYMQQNLRPNLSTRNVTSISKNNVCLWKLLNRPQILVKNIKALTARANWCGKTNRILTHCSITVCHTGQKGMNNIHVQNFLWV